jgi:transcriptional regulator with XRE-family HTH domain
VSTVLQKFGERVRDTRERQGLTQEQLAGRAGLDRSYVGGVERGEHNISLSNILKIARALGVSAADLLEEEDSA